MQITEFISSYWHFLLSFVLLNQHEVSEIMKKGAVQDSEHVPPERLSVYASHAKEMSPRERNGIKEHVLKCGTCRDRYGNLLVPEAFKRAS